MMNALTASWRCSLAAAALALFTAGCSDAVADGPPSEESLPAAVAGGLSDADGQLALLAEDEEAEAREREEREHQEAEARERREREQRERREAEMGRPQLLREIQILETKARDLRRELEGLRDDQDAEARELQAALGETEERMGAIRRELRGPERERERPEIGERERAELAEHLGNLRQHSRELDERAAAIRRELEGVRRDEQPDEARELQNMLREVRGAAERVEGEMREIIERLGRRPEQPDADRPRPEQPGPKREQLKRHLEELKAVIGRLAEAGRHEEAEAKEREAREIIRQLERRTEPPRPLPPGEDLERRIHHVKVAIENLHAAGLHEQADRLAEQVDRLIQEHRRGDRPEPPRPPESREQPPRPELGQRLEQQEQAIHELRGAVEQLHREIGQLREMLQELVGRQREGRR